MICIGFVDVGSKRNHTLQKSWLILGKAEVFFLEITYNLALNETRRISSELRP